MSPFRPLVPAGVSLLAAALLIACTTAPVTDTSAPAAEPAEAETPITVRRTDNEASAEGNVNITATPPETRVFIHGTERGTTPLTLHLPRGSYRLAADKELHYRTSRWIDIRSPEQVTEIEIRLSPKRGTFSPRFDPPDSTVTVNGTPITALPTELPAGSYTVKAKRFGYSPIERTVHIRPGSESSPVFELEPAPFSLEELRTEPPVVFPHDPGSLGEARFRFTLSGPARVEALLRSPEGETVFRMQRTFLRRSGQYIRWSPASSRTASLPEGRYRLELSAKSLADGERRTAATHFDIRHAPRETLRSGLVGGSPGGALLSPTALLPHGGSGRLNLVTIAGAFDGGISSEGRSFPQLIGAAWSIDDRHHLGLTGGLRLHESASPAPRGAISYSGALLRGGTGADAKGLSISAALNARYAHRPGTASLPGLYHGFGAGCAVTLHSGLRRPLLLSLSLAPELQFDPWAATPEARTALRGALALETPRWQAALSAALKSSPFGTPFEAELPIAAAAELRAMLPDSPAAFSLLMLAKAGPGGIAAHAGVSLHYYFSLPSLSLAAPPHNAAKATPQEHPQKHQSGVRGP